MIAVGKVNGNKNPRQKRMTKLNLSLSQETVEYANALSRDIGKRLTHAFESGTMSPEVYAEMSHVCARCADLPGCINRIESGTVGQTGDADYCPYIDVVKNMID